MIPVLLPGIPPGFVLPLTLKAKVPVDFREKTPDPCEQLYWGITGSRYELEH